MNKVSITPDSCPPLPTLSRCQVPTSLKYGILSWLLQSALSGPKAGGTWRPIIDLSSLNTHIQCPSFKMETMVSPQALQRAVARQLDLEHYIPRSQSTISLSMTSMFCHEGVVWQSSSSIWVKHYTSVYCGHGTCFDLRPSQWDQPSRLITRLTITPYIGRVSQTANPKVIGALHMPRMGGKRGEVKFDSFSGDHLGFSLDSIVALPTPPPPPERRIERWLSLPCYGYDSWGTQSL